MVALPNTPVPFRSREKVTVFGETCEVVGGVAINAGPVDALGRTDMTFTINLKRANEEEEGKIIVFYTRFADGR